MIQLYDTAGCMHVCSPAAIPVQSTSHVVTDPCPGDGYYRRACTHHKNAMQRLH
jgi:hypothetical protein